MRIKSLFVIILISCLSFATNNTDLRIVKKQLSSTQKEIENLHQQRKKILLKREKTEENFYEAVAKCESYQEKPNSQAYKSAVRKVESLQDKVETLNNSIVQIEKEIDSLNYIVERCQMELEVGNEGVKENNNEETDTEREACEYSNNNSIYDEHSIVVDNSLENQVNDIEYNVSEAQSNDSDDNSVTLWFWGSLFIIGIIKSIGIFIKTHHCSGCKKWFTMEYVGDVGMREYGQGENGRKVFRLGAKKKYVCRQCGASVTIIKWFR